MASSEGNDPDSPRDNPYLSQASSPRSPLGRLSIAHASSNLITRSETPVEAEATSITTPYDIPFRNIFTSAQALSPLSDGASRTLIGDVTRATRTSPVATDSSAIDASQTTSRPLDTPSPSNSAPQPRNFPVPGTEKDLDDPTSTTLPSADSNGVNTSQTLNNLFAGMPTSLSRHTTQGRTFSNVQRALHDTTTLNGYLLHAGFMEGRHSDIAVHAFGRVYKLHKLLLERVPFFSMAFSGLWAEGSAKEMLLQPDDIDLNITQSAFELALKRIYGTFVPYEEEQESIGLFATACWLDMPDLVESCIENILRQMRPSRLHVLIKLATQNVYGKSGDRILSSAKAMLCRDGWEMPFEFWDEIPAEIVREVISGDPFYIPGEWERWYLAVKLLNRRLRRLAMKAGLISPQGIFIQPRPKHLRHNALRPDNYKEEKPDTWRSLYQHPEIVPLFRLLDAGIHYMHLRFEQLQQMRLHKDIFGIPILPEKVISDALWISMELRQRVLNAQEGDVELGLSEIADDSEDEDEEAAAAILSTKLAKGKQVEDETASVASTTSTPVPPVEEPRRKFWIPSTDVSCVLGGSSEAYAASSFAATPDWASRSQRLSATFEPTDTAWSSDLGGSIFDSHASPARQLLANTPPRYSRYPPFRFCAEFPNPRTLKERKRVYSQTVWYAGSMWNLYIQRVNTSRNQQLGIYLHRAKDKDHSDDPLALTVDDRIGHLEREMLLRKASSRNTHYRLDVYDSETQGHSSSEFDADLGPQSMPASVPRHSRHHSHERVPHHHQTASSNLLSSIPATRTTKSMLKPSSQPSKTSFSTITSDSVPQAPLSPSEAPLDSVPLVDIDESDLSLIQALSQSSYTNAALQPSSSATTNPRNVVPYYTDIRTTIKTYFKIYSPSKAGRLLSVYESAPDMFNFGKSWGWKSSQMVLDDGIGEYERESPKLAGGNGSASATSTGVSSNGVAGQMKSSGESGLAQGGKDSKLRYMVVIGNV